LSALIQTLDQENKLVAAICAGPQFLSQAGILEDRKFTLSETADSLRKNGYPDDFNWDNYMEKNVVISDHIITAQGQAFIEFSAEIMNYFKPFETESGKEAFINGFRGL